MLPSDTGLGLSLIAVAASLAAVLLVWVGLAHAASLYAARLNRSGLGWFGVAVFFSPLVAWSYLFALGPRTDETMLDCPYCAEPVRVEAVRCPHCHGDLSAQASPGATGRRWLDRRA